MWADITVPYWMLLLAALVLFLTVAAFFWVTHRYVVFYDEANRMIEELRSPKPKHYFWIGRHDAGDQFFRMNNIPRSRCHYVSGRGSSIPHGYRESEIVLLWGYGSQASEFDPVRDVITMHFPNAETWSIP